MRKEGFEEVKKALMLGKQGFKRGEECLLLQRQEVGGVKGDKGGKTKGKTVLGCGIAPSACSLRWCARPFFPHRCCHADVYFAWHLLKVSRGVIILHFCNHLGLGSSNACYFSMISSPSKYCHAGAAVIVCELRESCLLAHAIYHHELRRGGGVLEYLAYWALQQPAVCWRRWAQIRSKCQTCWAKLHFFCPFRNLVVQGVCRRSSRQIHYFCFSAIAPLNQG